MRDAKPIAWSLWIASMLSLISIAVWLIAPEITGRATNILNEYWNGNAPQLNSQELLQMCLFLMACYVLKAICDSGKVILMNNYVSRYFTASLRIRISEKIKHLPVSFVDTTPNGEVISRMTHDVSRMGNSLHSIIEMAIMGFIQIIAIATLMFLKNWVLALIVCITVPISFFIASKVAMLGEKHYAEQRKQSGKLYAHVEEHYSGFSTVKAYNLEKSQEKKTEQILEKFSRASGKASSFQNWFHR
jgi:ABC-type multidrug transport system, ATPase and permease components